MTKILKAVLLLGIVYVAPLATDLQRLLSPPLLIAMAGALVLMFSQPEISRSEAHRNKATDRGSVLSILLAGVIAHVLPVIEWKVVGFPWPSKMQIAGCTLMTLGLILRVHSIRYLGSWFTATVQVQVGHELITDGPYAHVRHPSYLGSLLAITCHALVLGAPVSAGIAALLMAMVYRYRIQVEELAMLQAFGERYRAYQLSTARLIPHLW